jgi:hypothetical protein
MLLSPRQVCPAWGWQRHCLGTTQEVTVKVDGGSSHQTDAASVRIGNVGWFAHEETLGATCGRAPLFKVWHCYGGLCLLSWWVIRLSMIKTINHLILNSFLNFWLISLIFHLPDRSLSNSSPFLNSIYHLLPLLTHTRLPFSNLTVGQQCT